MHTHLALEVSSDGSESTRGELLSSDDDLRDEEVGSLSLYRTCRKSVYFFLNPHFEEQATFSTVYQIFAALMIIGLFIVDSTSPPSETTSLYWISELLLLILWSTEHILRLWSCVEHHATEECFWARIRVRLVFGIQPFMLIETVSLVSLVVDLSMQTNEYRGLAALRMLRLFTLYRIEREFNIFGPVIGVLVDKQKELLATLSIAALVLIMGAIVMFYVESATNDQFNTVAMSMWWCATALTTVGYGDIVPITVPGRILASLVAFMGTGMFGLFAAVLADGFRERIQKQDLHRKKQKAASKDDLRAPAVTQQDVVEVLEERMRKQEEASIARTAALQEDIQGLRRELQLVLKLVADSSHAAADRQVVATA